MPTIDVYNANAEKVSQLDLDDKVFGARVKEHLFYAMVRYQLAKRRAGTHKAKSRSEVAGGGRKPFRQKGTGRARSGTSRAPQKRGGGVVFGPLPRSHAFKLNKKVRCFALKGALSRRVEENKLVIVDELSFPEIKTRQVVDFMKRFELSDALVVLAEDNDSVQKSARNVPGVDVLPSSGLNVYDILRKNHLVMTQGAVEAVTARLGG